MTELKALGVAIATLILCSCTPAQIQTAIADQAKIQADLNAGCADYQATVGTLAPLVAVSPQAQVIMGFGSGACVGTTATAALVTRALNDPGTQAWLIGLSTDLKGL